MKKIVIPTILVATILVAGIFAMMPIQKVATIHSSLGAGGSGGTVNVMELTDADNDVGDLYTLNCATDAVITGINVFTAGSPTDNDVDLVVGGEAVVAATAIPAGNTVILNANYGMDAAETAVLTSGAETDGGDESAIVKITTDGGGACTLT